MNPNLRRSPPTSSCSSASQITVSAVIVSEKYYAILTQVLVNFSLFVCVFSLNSQFQLSVTFGLSNQHEALPLSTGLSVHSNSITFYFYLQYNIVCKLI